MIDNSLLQGVKDRVALDLAFWDWSGEIGDGEDILGDG